MIVKLDKGSGAWSDGNRFVKGSVIRKYSAEKMGRKQLRGRISTSEIKAYWLDNYGVSVDVA